VSRRIGIDNVAAAASRQHVETLLDEIERELDLLERRGRQLSEQWSGEATEAFERAHRKWDASARELRRIAHAVNAVARTGGQRLDALDRANARVWSF
jgi:WXG100 family type VII secretion target